MNAIDIFMSTSIIVKLKADSSLLLFHSNNFMNEGILGKRLQPDIVSDQLQEDQVKAKSQKYIFLFNFLTSRWFEKK